MRGLPRFIPRLRLQQFPNSIRPGMCPNHKRRGELHHVASQAETVPDVPERSTASA